MKFYDDQTESSGNTFFAKCPSCQQNFVLESENGEVDTKARKCKFCQFWIDESGIILSSSLNQTLIGAIQSAGEIKGFNFAIPIIAGLVLFEALIGYMLKDDFPFFAHVFFIFTSVYFYSGIFLSDNWLKKYKDVRIYDGELMAAKKDIKVSRIAWSTGLSINAVFWLLFLVLNK